MTLRSLRLGENYPSKIYGDRSNLPHYLSKRSKLEHRNEENKWLFFKFPGHRVNANLFEHPHVIYHDPILGQLTVPDEPKV